jgi:hypothetical protein
MSWHHERFRGAWKYEDDEERRTANLLCQTFAVQDRVSRMMERCRRSCRQDEGQEGVTANALFQPGIGRVSVTPDAGGAVAIESR